ncbi:MAG: hypothetical protein BJ554DRAFT_7510, partial [Olpidium bornovanus]
MPRRNPKRSQLASSAAGALAPSGVPDRLPRNPSLGPLSKAVDAAIAALADSRIANSYAITSAATPQDTPALTSPCFSLQGSQMCPAFASATVRFGANLVADDKSVDEWGPAVRRVFANVKNVQQFDNELRNFLALSSEKFYENVSGLLQGLAVHVGACNLTDNAAGAPGEAQTAPKLPVCLSTCLAWSRSVISGPPDKALYGGFFSPEPGTVTESGLANWNEAVPVNPDQQENNLCEDYPSRARWDALASGDAVCNTKSYEVDSGPVAPDRHEEVGASQWVVAAISAAVAAVVILALVGTSKSCCRGRVASMWTIFKRRKVAEATEPPTAATAFGSSVKDKAGLSLTVAEVDSDKPEAEAFGRLSSTTSKSLDLRRGSGIGSTSQGGDTFKVHNIQQLKLRHKHHEHPPVNNDEQAAQDGAAGNGRRLSRISAAGYETDESE